MTEYTEVITNAETGETTIRPFTEEEISAARIAAIPSKHQQETLRAAAYRDESDPIFFMAQRGEATMEEWKAKVAEIKARFTYLIEQTA